MMQNKLQEGVYLFSAEWCAPCKQIKGMLNDEPVTVLDVEENIDTVEEYSIMSVPTLIDINSRGEEITRHTGAFKTRDELLDFLYNK